MEEYFFVQAKPKCNVVHCTGVLIRALVYTCDSSQTADVGAENTCQWQQKLNKMKKKITSDVLK